MIIAEIGQNWIGDVALGYKLIELAKENGADLAKFQLFDSEKLYGKWAPGALTYKQAMDFFEYGKQVGIEVFFSVFDLHRVQWCIDMGVGHYKIAESMNQNAPLIAACLATGKQVFISRKYGVEPNIKADGDVLMLITVPSYPATITEYNIMERDISLRAMVCANISDHTIGLDLAKVAFARHAKVVEKHFAIDHKTGVDAEWSMSPDELKELKRWETICQQVL